MKILILWCLMIAQAVNNEADSNAKIWPTESYSVFDLPRFEGREVQPRRLSFNGKFLLAESESGDFVSWDFENQQYKPIRFPDGVTRSELGKTIVTDDGALVANANKRDMFISRIEGTSTWLESAPMRFSVVGPGESAGIWTVGGTGNMGQTGTIIWNNRDAKIEMQFLPDDDSSLSYEFRDINPSGVVVGSRWELACYLTIENGEIIEIPPRGRGNCWLEHVNSNGVALGYDASGGFLWDPAGKWRDLNCGDDPKRLSLHGISGNSVILGSLVSPDFGNKREFVIWDGTTPENKYVLLKDLIRSNAKGDFTVCGFKWGTQQSDDGKIIVDLESASGRRTVVLIPMDPTTE